MVVDVLIARSLTRLRGLVWRPSTTDIPIGWIIVFKDVKIKITCVICKWHKKPCFPPFQTYGSNWISIYSRDDHCKLPKNETNFTKMFSIYHTFLFSASSVCLVHLSPRVFSRLLPISHPEDSHYGSTYYFATKWHTSYSDDCYCSSVLVRNELWRNGSARSTITCVEMDKV